MERDVVKCEQCGQPYTVRVRDEESVIVPTETGECAECGGTEFSPLVTKRDDD